MTGIVANLMRPTKNAGTLGETQGTPQFVCGGIQFRKFTTISGAEGESARRNYATAQYAIDIWGDPGWGTLEECWLEILPLTNPPRKFNIVSVEDRKLNGLDLRLLCGETK